ncbi:MAG: 4Fe-4S binding protein [Candidatus Omnitrophica bacterium]|nr:4Fe-4S binding protein [Candidatus Omnitrophota bacterium]
MDKRKIIKIDESKCNGCGLCVPNCPEGALQIINGKARLVGELLCDGLGACIGECPEGAILIDEREAEKYSEDKAMENISKEGPEVIAAHLKHLKSHSQDDYLKQAYSYLKKHKINIPEEEVADKTPSGCSETMMRDFRKETKIDSEVTAISTKSQLQQWPIQLQLLNSTASYFKDADLVIAADCVAFSFSTFHQRFLKGKILVIFCPKLDKTLGMYLEKLVAIFKQNNIKSITLLHMEVSCCSGVVTLVQEALKKSGKNIIVKDYMISINGELV